MTRKVAGLLLLAGAGGLEACSHAPLVSPAMHATDLPAPGTLADDHFRRDRPGGLSEEALKAILDAPVSLDDSQRLGVLPVTDAYRPELGLPLPPVPAELTRSLDAAGLFQATSEVSTDWPVDGDIPGLRELAARYRSGYLLLYRHRFLDQTYANAWAWLYPTLIGAILAPSRTLETAGVLEATLFDVRTGTILFTVYERVRARSDETPWGDDRKLRSMKLRLLEEAAGKLAEQVVSKARHLIAAKRRSVAPGSVSSALDPGGSAGPPAADLAAVPVVPGAESRAQRRLFVGDDEQMEGERNERRIPE